MITIHSDDFGYKNYTDKKVVQLLRKGRINSVSVLANMVDRNSIRLLKNALAVNKKAQVGIHINFTDGKSIYENPFIPSLVDKRNDFYRLPKFLIRLFLGMVDVNHMEKEAIRQIQYLKQQGIKVRFLDSHNHIHAVSPIAEMFDRICRTERIKQIRSYKRVKNFTLIAKLKNLVLKLGAYVFNLRFNGKLELPAPWKKENGEKLSFMSWEGDSFDVASLKEKNLVVVAHPYLPFDSNKSYIWMLM